MSAKELIGIGTRVVIRDMVSGIVLRDIHAMWEAENFPPPPKIEPIGGERVTLYEAYLRQVDAHAQSLENIFYKCFIKQDAASVVACTLTPI